MRTNKRRNLNSSQWAMIAIEADEIINAIKEAVGKERREKIKEATKEKERDNKGTFKATISGNKLPNLDTANNKTSQKVAETFNTNRTYIQEATNLKEKAKENKKKLGNASAEIC